MNQPRVSAIGLTHLVLLLSGATMALGQAMSYDPTVLDSHPTVAEFQEEVRRADIVVRARIAEIVHRRDGQLGEETAIIKPSRIYKGSFDSESPCVRMEFRQSLQWKEGARLPDVGEEVILPIEVVHPWTGAPPPGGEKVHYFADFYYLVLKDERIESIFGFPPEMRKHATLEGFERLIVEQAERPADNFDDWRTAETLFTDDFEDGSLAGWVFLEGERGFREPSDDAERVRKLESWNDVIWVGPASVLRNVMPDGKENPSTRMVPDPQTGMLSGLLNGTPIEIGVADGRLRLRGGHYWLHLVAVAGDPQWTDCQIDVDVYNFNDPAFEGKNDLGQVNYLKFGPYGRLNVPNLPQTRGEHSFVGVEFGTFGNYDVSEMTFGNSAFQIRCKYPEPPQVWRDQSVLLRSTRILDYQAWPIPQEKKIHLRAKYFGRRVEGWIDGRKILEGEIPEDHPGAKSGRFALWAFETWTEFDNVTVTRLVREDD